mmetsp:Transcript_13616/g.34479  ORF Transcript_13616/g.34479 Transcript_13616/m.34479 type:complete len:296 (+) Transcript_13616:150-1037(+)
MAVAAPVGNATIPGGSVIACGGAANAATPGGSIQDPIGGPVGGGGSAPMGSIPGASTIPGIIIPGIGPGPGIVIPGINWAPIGPAITRCGGWPGGGCPGTAAPKWLIVGAMCWPGLASCTGTGTGAAPCGAARPKAACGSAPATVPAEPGSCVAAGGPAAAPLDFAPCRFIISMYCWSSSFARLSSDFFKDCSGMAGLGPSASGARKPEGSAASCCSGMPRAVCSESADAEALPTLRSAGLASLVASVDLLAAACAAASAASTRTSSSESDSTVGLANSLSSRAGPAGLESSVSV